MKVARRTEEEEKKGAATSERLVDEKTYCGVVFWQGEICAIKNSSPLAPELRKYCRIVFQNTYVISCVEWRWGLQTNRRFSPAWRQTEVHLSGPGRSHFLRQFLKIGDVKQKCVPPPQSKRGMGNCTLTLGAKGRDRGSDAGERKTVSFWNFWQVQQRIFPTLSHLIQRYSSSVFSLSIGFRLAETIVALGTFENAKAFPVALTDSAAPNVSTYDTDVQASLQVTFHKRTAHERPVHWRQEDTYTQTQTLPS